MSIRNGTHSSFSREKAKVRVSPAKQITVKETPHRYTFQIDKRLRSSSIIFDQSFIWTFWIVFNSRVRTCFKVPAIVIKVTGGMVHYARTWSPGRPTQSVKTKTWGKVESQFPAPSFSGYSATFVQPVPLLNGRCPRHCITTALSTAPASQSIQTVYCVLY